MVWLFQAGRTDLRPEKTGYEDQVNPKVDRPAYKGRGVFAMNTHELTLLMYEVAETAAETALIRAGVFTEHMKRAEAYKRASRRSVDKAIQNGALPHTVKGTELLIKRIDFKKWNNKNYWL